MAFTPQVVIERARVLLNDTRSVKRYSDEQMLWFFNDAMQRMFTLRPDAFSTEGLAFTPEVASYRQLAPTGTTLFGIQRAASGSDATAVREVDWWDFTNSEAAWVSDSPGLPTKFVKDPHNPRVFYLNPPPASGVSLTMFAALQPAQATSLTAPSYERPKDNFIPALTDCVVFLASSVDDEHVSSQRAQMFYESFVNQLGAGEQVTRRNSLSPTTRSQEMRNDAQ